MLRLSEKTASVDFFWDEDIFDAGFFVFDLFALGIDVGKAVPIDDFDDALGLVLGLPEDADVAGLAEAGIEGGGDEILVGGGGGRSGERLGRWLRLVGRS